MPTLTITQGSTYPPLSATLRDDDGNPEDLRDAATVYFRMGTDSELIVDSEVTIVDAMEGRVQYEWSPGDTDHTGTWRSGFLVERDDGSTVWFPSGDERLDIRVSQSPGGVETTSSD